MARFKEILRFLLFPILHSVRAIIRVILHHAIPRKEPEIPSNCFSYPHTAFDNFAKEESEKCYNHFKKYFKNIIFLDVIGIRNYAIKKAILNDDKQDKNYIEFGVWKGKTVNMFSNFLKTKIYAFDSFVGMREDWTGASRAHFGIFDLEGKIPKLNKNVIPIKGWVQDTLPEFIKNNEKKINFIHMDMDTYITSKFILEQTKPYLTKGCIILFDQLINFNGWDVGEYKALTETFDENEYSFLSFSINGQQAVIQIL